MNLALPSPPGKMPFLYWYTCWGFFYLSHYILTALHSLPFLLIWRSALYPHWVSSLKRQQTTRSTNPLTPSPVLILTYSRSTETLIFFFSSTALCSLPSAFPFPQHPLFSCHRPFSHPHCPSASATRLTPKPRHWVPLAPPKPHAHLSNCLCSISTGVAHWHSTAALIVLSSESLYFGECCCHHPSTQNQHLNIVYSHFSLSLVSFPVSTKSYTPSFWNHSWHLCYYQSNGFTLPFVLLWLPGNTPPFFPPPRWIHLLNLPHGSQSPSFL